MKLLPEERETIILWSDADDTASVYTHDRRLISRLRELSMKYPAQIYNDRQEKDGAVSYSVPKNCVSIRSPYSEARRQAQSRKAKQTGQAPPGRKNN